MNESSLLLLGATVLLPLFGAFAVYTRSDPVQVRRWSLAIMGGTLLLASAAGLNVLLTRVPAGSGPWDRGHSSWGLAADGLSALLLPLTALQFLLTGLTTPQTKLPRFSFSRALVRLAIGMGMFSCAHPWVLIGLLSLGALVPFAELRVRGAPTRTYVLHMGLSTILVIVGWALVEQSADLKEAPAWVFLPLLAGLLIRTATFPFHTWVGSLFEHAGFGMALLVVLPMTGAYAFVRLALPIVPDWALHGVGTMSLVTAIYCAGLALVQRDVRRFLCQLFLSQSALLLVGLDAASPIGLTGALCTWTSAVMSLACVGLILRALEARFGRLSLAEFHGLYEALPLFAVCLLLSGLACVGLPGTLGFIGAELLMEGALESYPHVGAALVVVEVLNGIAIMRAYFCLFTGRRRPLGVPVGTLPRERMAILGLSLLLLLGGIYPQPWVAYCGRVAADVLRPRGAEYPPIVNFEPDRVRIH